MNIQELIEELAAAYKRIEYLQVRVSNLEKNDFVTAEEISDLVPVPTHADLAQKLCNRYKVRSKLLGSRRLYLRTDVVRMAHSISRQLKG